jgi:hypothetical protein
MYIGIMDSESLEWMSLGHTETEAKQAILDSWNSHQRTLVHNGSINTPLIFGSIIDLEKEYDIEINKIEPGECKFW